MAALTAAEIIRLLDLKPHPEGGHYRETFRDSRLDAAGRAASTAIYFLLARGERSPWHRVDMVEVWHWLGPDLAAGEVPQAVVPAGHWQAAETRGDWTLAGCTVSPGFEFAGFELAPKGWSPKA